MSSPTLTHRYGSVFLLSAGLFLMSMLFRATNAIIAPDLSRDLGLSPEQLGVLGASFFYASALIQIPLGPALDRFGARRTMIVLNSAGIVGAFLFALAPGYGSSLAGRTLLGVGMAANFMGPLKLFTRHFAPHEFATASGILVSVGTLGSVMATSPLAVLNHWFGWRGAFGLLAGTSLLLLVLFAIFIRDEDRREPSPAAASSPFRDALYLAKDPSFWAAALAAGLRYGSFASIQTLWAGPFLMIYLGLTTVMAGHMLLILNLGFILAAPLAGWASDRLGSRKWLITFSLAAMALIVWGLSGLTRPAGMILVALLWIGLGVATSPGQLMYAHAKERMPAHMSGTAMTAINFFVFLGAAVFVHGLGEILGRTQGGLANGEGYQRAFFFCSVALALAAFLYALTKDTRAPQAGEPGPSAAVKS